VDGRDILIKTGREGEEGEVRGLLISGGKEGERDYC